MNLDLPLLDASWTPGEAFKRITLYPLDDHGQQTEVAVDITVDMFGMRRMVPDPQVEFRPHSFDVVPIEHGFEVAFVRPLLVEPMIQWWRELNYWTAVEMVYHPSREGGRLVAERDGSTTVIPGGDGPPLELRCLFPALGRWEVSPTALVGRTMRNHLHIDDRLDWWADSAEFIASGRSWRFSRIKDLVDPAWRPPNGGTVRPCFLPS